MRSHLAQVVRPCPFTGGPISSTEGVGACVAEPSIGTRADWPGVPTGAGAPGGDHRSPVMSLQVACRSF
jgi:hypothetical protein